jgi:hypothetical protein
MNLTFCEPYFTNLLLFKVSPCKGCGEHKGYCDEGNKSLATLIRWNPIPNSHHLVLSHLLLYISDAEQSMLMWRRNNNMKTFHD